MKEQVYHCELQSDKCYHTHTPQLYVTAAVYMMKSSHVNMDSSSIFQGGIAFPPARSSTGKEIIGYRSTSQEVHAADMDVEGSLRMWGWSVVFDVPDVTAGFLCCWVAVWFPPASDVSGFSISIQPVELVCESCSTFRTDSDVLMRHTAYCFTEESSARREANWLCCNYTQSLFDLLQHISEDLIKPECCFLHFVKCLVRDY